MMAMTTSNSIRVKPRTRDRWLKNIQQDSSKKSGTECKAFRAGRLGRGWLTDHVTGSLRPQQVIHAIINTLNSLLLSASTTSVFTRKTL